MAEAEKGINSFELVKEAIYKFPLPLLELKNDKLLKSIDSIFPYSHGMEFECHKKDSYNIQEFKDIPDIMAVDVDNYEQRYRIPSGLKGLVCLYRICEQLKLNSKIDPGSSNHYHTDLTDVFHLIPHKDAYETHPDYVWIIESLKTWNSYRSIESAKQGSWFKFNTLNTLEIRIGEPSFDYEVIVGRLIQCANIANKIKANLDPVKYKLNKLQEELATLEEKKEAEFAEDEIQKIINERNIKI